MDLRAEIRLDLPLGTIAAAGGDDHPAMLEDSILPNRLSAAQHQFADAHSANPALRSQSHSGSIFMYRNEGRRTHRWLVDELGRTIESASFLR